ncbi:hypothetical protein [Streptomyces sp. NPDC093260]|uniref:hypothetical protein n=1 Tax=Streptomyces sp. NPDC093260 TaxID=3155073 RepID=UPI00343256AB
MSQALTPDPLKPKFEKLDDHVDRFGEYSSPLAALRDVGRRQHLTILGTSCVRAEHQLDSDG